MIIVKIIKVFFIVFDICGWFCCVVCLVLGINGNLYELCKGVFEIMFEYFFMYSILYGGVVLVVFSVYLESKGLMY